MAKYLILLFVLFGSKASFAGTKDSLFVAIKDERAMIVYEVAKGDNLYSIAQLYSVPALVLSQTNDVAFYDNLEPKRKLFIPMGNYNYLRVKPETHKEFRPLYYKVQAGDNYTRLSKNLSIDEGLLRNMNNGKELSAVPNNIALMGWVNYMGAPDAASTNAGAVAVVNTVAPASLAPGAVIPKADSVRLIPSELEMQYNYQTSDGIMHDSTSGMVVFYKPQTTVNNKLLYAFSNEISKGRVVKVVNPSNGKFVFAKVIGPLPATKQYLNAKIGVDGRARAELETREVKLWCDLLFKY